MLAGKRILLIVSGGIAAYKSLEIIRRLRERRAQVKAVLTAAAEQFVTPLSVSALSEEKVYSDLFSLTDEAEMGHIQLSRAADLAVVAPASADILAKLRAGLANDLASTLLLATDKPILAAPAMNLRMWEHPATQENLACLKERGLRIVGPNEGNMACGESGFGRMAEPAEILAAIEAHFTEGPLAGHRALVTSGPTHEPIDPVRYIANRSSGKQGHAIAAALRAAGARVTLVSGPTCLADPDGVTAVSVVSAREMLEACQAALPVEIAVFAAAVADWRIAAESGRKLKKTGRPPPPLQLALNPDILASISQQREQRPALIVGFAAETERVVAQAAAKRLRKGCDWILANDVSPAGEVFGGDCNTIHFIADGESEAWPRLDKSAVAERLVARIVKHFCIREIGT
ncbi:MAG: bifunctional phosphopantothenoylcysteine decarboxylase/phosphopantothenate--cysteine ligase CoaBC [Rhodospirillales bacterium]|nr:bifunctional phosphopantothenoylcysteine decarboxylase/phosphopantothenate--cysteine ligase CoaBC [Rhodospirillales bacterium]